MKKYRLNIKGKLFLTCLLFFSFYLIYSFSFKQDINITFDSNVKFTDNKINYEITDNYEDDNSVIQSIFMNGLSSDIYISLFDKLNYVNSNGSYNRVYYDFNRKMHYDEIENILYDLNNSDIVDLFILGSSVDNRNIYGIEVGNGDKVLFIDANIHAAEVAGTLILTRFLIEIVNDYEFGDEDIKKLLENVKIAIIPSINPDGYEVYNFGVESLNNKSLWWYENKDSINFENVKSNANGVDLNRNFPTQNSGLYYNSKKLRSNVSLVKTASSSKYYNGSSVGSEPEILSAMRFMLKHYKKTYAYINIHSQGRVIYAGKPNLSNDFNEISSDFAKKVSRITGYKQYGLNEEEVGEGNDGSATDFMAELANGFVFSSKTLRLSSDKYINNNCSLKYKYPVITLETLNTYTKDPRYFKNEYYKYGLRDLLYNLIDEDF